MPRFTIKHGALQSGVSGVSQGIQSWLGGDKTYQDAYDKENLNQSRIAQLAGLQSQQEAQANHYAAQAENERAKTGILQGRPGVYEEQAALNSGTDIPTIKAFRSQLAGNSPQVPMGPPTEDGQMDVGSFQAGPQTRSKISLLVQQFATMLTNTGDLKPDDMAKAAQLFRETGLSDAIINGTANRNTVAGAQAAANGKDLFSTNSDGAVLDKFGGGLDTSNPMAGATIKLRGAQAGQANAAAAEHYAGADLKKAQRGAVGQGGSKAPSGYQWVIDPITGEQIQQPIKGGPADKSGAPLKVSAEVQRQIGGIISVQKGLDVLEEALKDFDPRKPGDQINAAKRAKITSIAKQIQLDAKEAAALGALSGPDMSLLEGILADPTSPRGALFGKDGIKAQLREARLGNQRRVQALKQQYGDKAIPDLPATQPAPASRNIVVDY